MSAPTSRPSSGSVRSIGGSSTTVIKSLGITNHTNQVSNNTNSAGAPIIRENSISSNLINNNNNKDGGSNATNTSMTGGAKPALSKVHALEADGVARHLFPFILRMQHALRRSHQQQSSGGVDFALPTPDTIVYEHNFPQAWYTSDRKTGEIIKMPGKKLDALEIYDGFSVIERGCGGICAQFTAVHTEEDTGEIRAETTYLTAPALLEWIQEKEGAPKEGILQKFVPPRGENNDALQIVWSPYLCTMTRRANIHRLDSSHVPPRVRACTFDGPPHLSHETKGNAIVRDRIAGVLEKVAKHLLEKEHRKVARFVGLFKHDPAGNLWLLHMTSIRIQNDTFIELSARDPVQLSPEYIQPPSSCPDSAIERAMQLYVTLDGPSCFRDRHAYQRRHATILQQARAPQQRRDTMEVLAKAAARSRDQEGALPAEYRALDEFIEDTLYLLYSTRMTTLRGDAPPVAQVILPPVLQSFLGEALVERLMIQILNLTPEIELPDGSIVFSSGAKNADQVQDERDSTDGISALWGPASEGLRPLSIVRAECDALLTKARKPFNTFM